MSNAACSSIDATSDQNVPLLAIAGLVLAASFMGLGPIFVRFSGVSPEASAFWRMALATPVFIIAAGLMPPSKSRMANAPTPATGTKAHTPPQRFALIRRHPFLILSAGFLFAGDLVASHLAIAWTTVANAMLLVNLAPLFIGLLGLIGLARRPGKRFWWGTPFALIGGYCLFRASETGTGSVAGDAMAVLGAMFYAGYLTVIGRLRRDFSALEIMCSSTIVTALFLFALLVVRGDLEVPMAIGGWIALAGLAYVTHICGQGMVSVCFKRVDQATGAMVLLWQPFMSAFLGAVLLGEVLNVYHFLGGAAVVTALAIIAMRKRRTMVPA